MNLSEKEQRYLAVGILVTLLLLGATAIIVPVQLIHADYDAQIDIKKRQLHQYSKILAEKKGLKRQLAQLKYEITNNKTVFMSKNESIAFAELNDYVTHIVKKNRATLLSIRTQSVKDDSELKAYHKITVVIEMKSKIVSLQKILYQLEMSLPLLTIDNLKISTQLSQAKKAPFLFVRLDVNAFWKMRERKN